MSASLLGKPVRELVVEQPGRARLFELLGIDHCRGGGSTLDDACRARGLDGETVAALLESLDAGATASAGWARAPIADLCDHIVGVHHGFLRRELPRLGRLLERCERSHGLEHPDLVELRGAFERLREELECRLGEEERELFPRLRAGEPVEPALVYGLESEQAAVGRLLERLSTLTFGYDETLALCTTHRAALHGLAELEADLLEHVHEESDILLTRTLVS